MFSFFNRTSKPASVGFRTDMHSHLIPGIDDGVRSLQQSVDVIRNLIELGYEKFITTPHIMSDGYPNTPETIRKGLATLKEHLASIRLDVDITAAAEYYLDERTMTAVSSGEEMLTFGSRYLLFETNYLSEPFILKDFIFNATSKGYKLVLAHPERYQFMTVDKAQDLIDRGVYLQVNLLSLTGFYMKPVQKLAEKLIDQKMVSFLGTDCHNDFQARELQKVLRTNAFKKAIDLPLLNASL